MYCCVQNQSTVSVNQRAQCNRTVDMVVRILQLTLNTFCLIIILLILKNTINKYITMLNQRNFDSLKRLLLSRSLASSIVAKTVSYEQSSCVLESFCIFVYSLFCATMCGFTYRNMFSDTKNHASISDIYINRCYNPISLKLGCAIILSKKFQNRHISIKTIKNKLIITNVLYGWILQDLPK